MGDCSSPRMPVLARDLLSRNGHGQCLRGRGVRPQNSRLRLHHQQHVQIFPEGHRVYPPGQEQRRSVPLVSSSTPSLFRGCPCPLFGRGLPQCHRHLCLRHDHHTAWLLREPRLHHPPPPHSQSQLRLSNAAQRIRQRGQSAPPPPLNSFSRTWRPSVVCCVSSSEKKHTTGSWRPTSRPPPSRSVAPHPGRWPFQRLCANVLDQSS